MTGKWFHLGANRAAQTLSYIIGGAAGVILIFLLLLPDFEGYRARGPMNSGHEDFRCESCHREALGTFRQRAQANVKYLLGMRKTSPALGHERVDNAICLSCHERPNDRHPVFRFFEPRFAEARERINPQFCVSCHTEHTGARVTIETDYCQTCHEETKLKNDPITISHEDLIKSKRWTTCLGCHDFHGNHVMEIETDVSRAFPPERISDYFGGGASPYPAELYHKSKEEKLR
ncbi:MAG: cytochrome c3 family protein [Deltaproteobacteria bacterium]